MDQVDAGRQVSQLEARAMCYPKDAADLDFLEMDGSFTHMFWFTN